jgi:hypothetical protein
MGRTSLHDVYDPHTDELIIKAGEEISRMLPDRSMILVLRMLRSVLCLPAKASAVFV